MVAIIMEIIMLIEDVRNRLNEVIQAIEQAAANVNLLVGRGEELKHILGEMEKFQDKCDATCVESDIDTAPNAEQSALSQ
jgi:chemotaxis regulatin CheY-phosphate phosphatase CheZ